MKRSVEDEQMIQAIVDANPSKDFMYCVDTRPKVCIFWFNPSDWSVCTGLTRLTGLCHVT